MVINDMVYDTTKFVDEHP
ncbi:hypothetical protein CJF31_00010646 [Rutstroemia sp. NJR-2017a BVV2]|nr:hypothetical protein CJF31_00010646 [Rutstroemia sp. NJR-2017a BVV2]